MCAFKRPGKVKEPRIYSVTFRCRKSLYELLREVAADEDRSITYIIDHAIGHYLKSLGKIK